jgi:hypothetical protein
MAGVVVTTGLSDVAEITGGATGLEMGLTGTDRAEGFCELESNA